MKLSFTKMHGLGNDFVVFDNRDGKIALEKEQIIFLCDRQKGVGADGVILIEQDRGFDAFMNYYNNDGEKAGMCGNGIRCVAKYIFAGEKFLRINTLSGMKEIVCKENGDFSVNMGAPIFKHNDFPKEQKNIEGLDFSFVSMGNPHAVTFVDDLNKINFLDLGPKIENNVLFPNKINVEFVQKISDQKLKMKVWERGCGPTLACGTGACAVYGIFLKDIKSKGAETLEEIENKKNREAEDRKKREEGENIEMEEIEVELPGGSLYISKNEKGEILMRGPAVSVFEGEIDLA
ncbi:MAG: diaminopimelate epimerase [Candidatus Pacebacteria bacterium]|nr:diaminopimelate epimerase [Candidatus Paceibacterota bacterium]MCF7862693.1 diaminopimelate epimerase [Candidatus Paceibacterota bacterium]